MLSSGGRKARVHLHKPGFVLARVSYGVTWGELALAFAYFVACGMAITAGYHRLIAHRSYRCQSWLEACFLVAGAAAWQGSALDWASDHVRHHSYTDTPRDPYNIRQGIWHAHVGWLLRKQKPASVPPFLRGDRLLELQDRFYVPLATFVSFVVPYLVAGFGGLLLAGVVRTVVGHHVTWLINSLAHVGGRRPFEPRVSAADHRVLAFFTFGEGYHNYHHAFPNDYRNGVTAFAWDPSKWMIWAFSLVGITYELKRIGPVHQWRQRVRVAIEHGGSGSEGFARLHQTRAALEQQIASCRASLARTVAKAGSTLEVAHYPSIDELRERFSTALREARDAVSRASHRRAERIRELIESLTAYQALLDQLTAHEAKLVGACA
jgi:stearoyl-CoA desaturase (delta-9 desaturase)